MKLMRLTIITAFVTVANARLIEKNTDKPTETQATESPVPVRVSRQASYEDGMGISKEDNTQEVDLRTYVRKGRYSMKSKSSSSRATNRPKDIKEKAVTKIPDVETKPTKALIKKPIPKFNEVDYEDFQGKVNKSPVKFAESGEHEDEDFNLDDYEFDVNHDEFVGRGKPLEPRMKLKDGKVRSKKVAKPKTTLPPPEIKIQSKVVIPTDMPASARKLSITKKAADKMKEDYYDDVVTTTKVPETETKRDLDDEFPDDSEDSKEYRKNNARVARSPWFLKFLGDSTGTKTAAVMSKVLNALPFLSPVPSEYYEFSKVPQGIMKDPMTGRDFMF